MGIRLTLFNGNSFDIKTNFIFVTPFNCVHAERLTIQHETVLIWLVFCLWNWWVSSNTFFIITFIIIIYFLLVNFLNIRNVVVYKVTRLLFFILLSLDSVIFMLYYILCFILLQFDFVSLILKINILL